MKNKREQKTCFFLCIKVNFFYHLWQGNTCSVSVFIAILALKNRQLTIKGPLDLRVRFAPPPPTIYPDATRSETLGSLSKEPSVSIPCVVGTVWILKRLVDHIWSLPINLIQKFSVETLTKHQFFLGLYLWPGSFLKSCKCEVEFQEVKRSPIYCETYEI